MAEPAAAVPATADDLAAHRRRLEVDGYTIVEDAVPTALLDEIDEVLARLETDLDAAPSTNRFEGAHTVRVYNLLAHHPVFRSVPTHPVILDLVEGVLGPDPLISSLSSIAIDPGEVAQPLHADDALHPLPRPHPATVCNSMWALTDFTDANGATRLVPGSHLDGATPLYDADLPTVPAEMRRGSILVWHGSLIHGGGANRTNRRRTGLAMNYCAGWVRQQENQQLGIPLHVVAEFEPRLAALCGFGIYRGLVGHIDKRSPWQHLFDADATTRIVWDREPAPGVAR